MSDALGNRMKLYESTEAGRRLLPLLPVIARIDGRAFHSFTRGMRRPFDPDFTTAMVETTQHLVEETNACMGYTQSDEITLAWHSTDIKSQIWFDGRIHKMVSLLAAHATLHFYLAVSRLLPDYASRLPTFDARVWSVPTRTEGANAFLWREWDATKNSISMAASTYYSDSELHGLDGSAKQQLLFRKGVNWNDYPACFKRGTYIQRRPVLHRFTAEELMNLPPKHAAHSSPGLQIERHKVMPLDLPPLSQICNREAVIFEAAAPEVAARSDY